MARAIHSGIKSYLLAHPPSGTLVAWNKAQGGVEYTIAKGDTLSGIAQRFNVSLSTLKSTNGISGSTIRIGQKLTIPAT
jgi:N-acetylmuramoyl-L-alanine amidase